MILNDNEEYNSVKGDTFNKNNAEMRFSTTGNLCRTMQINTSHYIHVHLRLLPCLHERFITVMS